MPHQHEPSILESDVRSVLKESANFHPFRSVLHKQLPEESIFARREWFKGIRGAKVLHPPFSTLASGSIWKEIAREIPMDRTELGDKSIQNEVFFWGELRLRVLFRVRHEVGMTTEVK
jgi:hypothetical protein